MTRTAAVGAPLREPAFQRLWLGLSLSNLGDQFTIIALLWFILQLTGSEAAVGLVILCFDLPGVVTGAIRGRLLDRYQPRLVMGSDNLARAAPGRHSSPRFRRSTPCDRCSSGTSLCWRRWQERSRRQLRLAYGHLCRTQTKS
jgi:transmembrane secretion effector